ncbi:centrosomal protein of 128 kDa-like isoform X2 [Carassius carassius]|uniref:centrosomal protein of 128 kDa-like isoform X2 n=1 Tax=Carassius carassius TaxID=217509 RepID=UPI002868E7FF|nr:centrosomal protein of 128 kDa-like isoform X2 [Carassius carassius]
MGSSSESDTYDRPTGHRSRVRKRRTRPESGFPRDTHVSDISDKIDTLANTLKDTSRNLNKVDRMLGQYKEHTDDQAEAMATLRENLEESIQHLQAQQLKSSPGGRSTSFSTLHTSDLEDGSARDRRHYLPTSPLRDYGSGGTGSRRRSRSVAVRFTDSAQAEVQIHSLHQSLRDLQSDQLRIGDDIDREIRRRNRTDIETKKTLENLAGHIKASQKEEPVSLRVERRLQEIEDEMLTGRQALSERRHREKPKSMSSELQEMHQELEKLREQLVQAEGGRDTLLQKMDVMSSQLLRLEKERLDLQRELSLLLSQQRCARRQQEGGVTGLDSGRTELEREIEDLRVQLGRISVSSEVAELKKSIEQKEREKTQLTFRVEALSADLERREQQQLKMLAQLKEIQSRSEENVSECGRLEAQLIESERRREELRSKAQEALRQWKTKCKKLEREFQELKDNSRNNTDKDKRSKEREGILSQQLEGARKQLADALGHLAQREEDVRRCNVDLTETRSQLVTLELDLQEARETLRGLEEEAQKQISLQVRMREENIRLQKRVELQEHCKEEEQRSLLVLQGSVKNLSAERADLAARLAEVESSKKDLEKQLAMAQEESSSFGRQLELERQVHQKELSHLRMTLQEGKAQQDRDVHDMLRLYQREREELEALVRDLKSEAVGNGELRRALQLKLDKMKTECDKLMEQLSTSKENHAKLLHKYHALKKELDVKGKLAERQEERRQSAEYSMEELHEKVTGLQTEQDSILHAVGTQIDSACQFLSKDSAVKLEAITLTPRLQKDSHRWLAEVKTKLQWLCEEVRERESRERRLRRTLQQHKEQIKALKQSKDSELQSLLDHITLQDRLLKDIQSEKRGLLVMGHKKEDEMRNLQDRIVDLEMSTRLALDHLESVPEKLSLLENFKDLEESQKQREMVEQRYAKYKEIVGNLQHQLEESKKRIQEYRDEKLDAACRSLQFTSLSSSLLSQSNILNDTSLSTHTSLQKPLASPDLESSLTQEHFSTFNGANSKHTSI